MPVPLRVLVEIAVSLLSILFALRAASGLPSRAIVLCSWLALGSVLVVIVLTFVLIPFPGRHIGPVAARALADVRAITGSVGSLLIVAAWLFALYDAMQARRHGWLALITAGATLSLLAGVVRAEPSAFLPRRTVTNGTLLGLLIVEYLVGIAALLYGLQAESRARSARAGTAVEAGALTGPPPSASA